MSHSLLPALLRQAQEEEADVHEVELSAQMFGERHGHVLLEGRDAQPVCQSLLREELRLDVACVEVDPAVVSALGETLADAGERGEVEGPGASARGDVQDVCETANVDDRRDGGVPAVYRALEEVLGSEPSQARHLVRA